MLRFRDIVGMEAGRRPAARQDPALEEPEIPAEVVAAWAIAGHYIDARRAAKAARSWAAVLLEVASPSPTAKGGHRETNSHSPNLRSEFSTPSVARDITGHRWDHALAAPAAIEGNAAGRHRHAVVDAGSRMTIRPPVARVGRP